MDIEVDHPNKEIASMTDHPNVISISQISREVLALITPHTARGRKRGGGKGGGGRVGREDEGKIEIEGKMVRNGNAG